MVRKSTISAVSARTVSVINQKGGSAKTTTAVNLAACLARRGKKVLIIDFDPQAHATVHLGVMPKELQKSIYEVMQGLVTCADVIQPSKIEGLDLLPSHLNFASAELELANEIGRERILRGVLDGVRSKYDFIFIDCPPSLGLLTLNALVAADEVLLPVAAEFLALEGLAKLTQTIELVRKRLRHPLKILGVVVTRFDARKRLCQDVREHVKQAFQSERVFETSIRENVRLTEAPSHGKDIVAYDPKSHGAEDYQRLAEEILKT